MPNYKEQSLSGSQWQRCNSILIENYYQNSPKISMVEETIAVVGTNSFSVPAGNIQFTFDPAELISIIDNETDLPTGETVSFEKLYQILRSLYMQKAKQRDEAAIQAAAEAAAKAALEAEYLANQNSASQT